MQEVALGNVGVSIVENMSNSYSRMLGWEVWNFMTITHAKVEFDDRNVINFKGYNDSGKSAMLRALDVLMFNIKPSAQVSFIQDDTDYFRVMAYFDDNVVILRDKYINGQSLYEMYKDGECIYSTRQNGKLTRVADVPDVIKTYLGVVSFEGINLNSRSCWEKQLLVQTTGSENYKFLNTVLKSEEIAVASELLNTDINKLLSDSGAVDSELKANMSVVEGSEGVSGELLLALKEHDKNLDNTDVKLSSLEVMNGNLSNLAQIPSIPELTPIDTSRMDLLINVLNMTSKLSSIPNLPELKSIDSSKLDILAEASLCLSKLQSIPSLPVLKSVDLSQIDLLAKITLDVDKLNEVNSNIENANSRLSDMSKELTTLQATMTEFGSKFVKCKNCGALVEVGSEHSD